MQKELEITGKNIEDAIEKGLQELNCSKEDVETGSGSEAVCVTTSC